MDARNLEARKAPGPARARADVFTDRPRWWVTLLPVVAWLSAAIAVFLIELLG
ncbi:MAG: hypothetical protein ACRD0A_14085 [Acidimicrobiales bacterium]